MIDFKVLRKIMESFFCIICVIIERQDPSANLGGCRRKSWLSTACQTGVAVLKYYFVFCKVLAEAGVHLQ